MLAVIAYHFGILHASGGFLGVDLFFVLSGFLITTLLVRENRSTGTIHFTQFWARRFRRLMPASLLMLIGVSIWAWTQVDSLSLSMVRYDLLATLGYAANWRFIASGQSYFSSIAEASPLRHTWSLAIEEQFYVAWPLVTYLLLRRRKWGEQGLLLLCASGTLVSTVLMWILFHAGDPSRGYYGTDTRAAQLLVGGALAVIVTRRTSKLGKVSAQLLSAVTAVAVLACVFTVSDSTPMMYRGGFLAFSILVALLIVSTIDADSGPVHAALTWRPIVYIGRISYGLYLWHWPVSIAISAHRTSLSGVGLTLVRLAATFALAALSFHVLEKPIRYKTGWATFRGKSALTVGATAVAVTAAVSTFATVGAQAPPDFLAGRQDQILLTDDTTPGLDASAARILLVGDSIAASIQKAMKTEADRRQLHFFAGTRPGCGLTSGLPTDDKGVIVPWAHTCADSTSDYLQKMIDKTHPDLVLWLSSWDAMSRVVNGKLFDRFHTDFPDELYREIDVSVRILTSQGARVLFLTMPARARTSEIATGSEQNGRAVAQLNDILTTYHFAHPDSTAIIDLATLVCPAVYPCDPVVDGVTPRPRDGAHFGAEGATWVAPHLFDMIERVAKIER